MGISTSTALLIGAAVSAAGTVATLASGAKPPKVDKGPISDTEAGLRKAKTARSALYETAGGTSGSELDPNQVQRRSTLLGN